MPPEYWQAVLDDPLADARPRMAEPPTRLLRLSEIPQHILRVSCRRCSRILEIQRVDAVRLYGLEAAWKDVGQRLLDDTCQQRTGRHEEDGCWPGVRNTLTTSPAPAILRRGRMASKYYLAAMKQPPTTFVYHLASRLRCRKCAKAGRRPAATLLQLACQPRHPRTEA
jgi:hypothetical protein